MSRSNMRMALWIVTVLVLAVQFGCILSPDKGPCDNCGPPDTNQFRPLTDKENVIYNLVLSYKVADIQRYDDLLHPDFVWHNQKDPASPNLEEQWSRPEDFRRTSNMFKATRRAYSDPDLNLDRLELDIKAAAWEPVDSVGGAPCTDCWQTTREYYITAVTEGGDTYIGNDLSLFIVVPVDKDGTKIYQLWRQDDMPK